jgi:hypothetical protein
MTRSPLRAFCSVLLLFFGMFVALSATSPSANAVPSDVLLANNSLPVGGSLRSSNGNIGLFVQSDGNVVLYDAAMRALWATNKPGAATALILQSDGNLVLYAGARALWSSNTVGATQLIVQNDGNLVLHTVTGAAIWSSGTASTVGSTGNPDSSVTPTGLSNPGILPRGGSLRDGQGLTSANGRFFASLQRDGNFIIFGPDSQADWATSTGGRTGAAMYLQSDGNLVIYGGTGAVLFTPGVAAGAYLAMQSDGNLVLYTASWQPVWSASAGSPWISPQLHRGETLLAGQKLPSPSGRYYLTQQSDGNLVVYGPSRAMWSSNTVGSSATSTVFGLDGNLSVVENGGARLYMTFTSGLTSLYMQDDGNLVIYLSNGMPVWASSGLRPSPAFLSAGVPQTTTPPTSRSRYVRNLGNVTADRTYWRARGVADAAGNPSGHQYIALLDIGGQTSNGYTQLSATSVTVSYAVLVSAVNAYVDGYASAMQPNAPAVIAVGANNDMVVNVVTGIAWAQQVVNPVAIHAAPYAGITIAGANDIEPGFAAGPAATSAWLSGYLAATGQPFIFNGSADGCSSGGANGKCNHGWTAWDLYQLSTGMRPSQMLSLPQIYNSTMAKQWRYISLTGVVNGMPKVNFGGVLTEVSACNGGCASPDTGVAWNWLWSNLQAQPQVSVPSMPWGTDLAIN